MAHADNSVLLRKLRGMLNKEVVFREWDGKTIVQKAPKRKKGNSTPDQEETRINFKLASRYAIAICKAEDQSLAEAYAMVLKSRQNVFSRATQDFMSVPEIKFIRTDNYRGITGDKIIIRAIDDFRVLNVMVEIYSANGNLVEWGNAAQNVNGIDWTYLATGTHILTEGFKIKAIAKDVPGHEGMLEVVV